MISAIVCKVANAFTALLLKTQNMFAIVTNNVCVNMLIVILLLGIHTVQNASRDYTCIHSNQL